MKSTGIKSHTSHRLSALGLLVTIGIVFGDIGTSPLYVMKAITHVNPTYDADYIIGAVSCIIWTLTLQTTLKYVVIALRADNKGEGGILALYALVRRLRHKWLYVVAAIGASALIADGIITPAVTVTSAIEGLRAVNPSAPVVAITLVTITIIFVVQRFGTDAIGRCFGPFMLAWFLMLGVLGVLNIGDFPGIMKAFNPWYAVKMLVDYPGWFLVLGAVFLCTTGAEALYSDLGHCGRLNITVSWVYVKIMLILNYLGQGAWIIGQGELSASVNPFYGIMPHWFLVPGIIMATGAAIIASQALISGSFTIFSEAINLNFWPRLKIKYPGALRGQLYVPSINLFLYLGCVVAVLLFRTSARMEAAYGLAITVTMLMTTILLGCYLRHKGLNRYVTGLFLAFFITVEGIFFAANAVKFMHGGWFTMLIAGLVCSVMVIWYRASGLRKRYFEYKKASEYYDIISDIKNDHEIPKHAANLIYISHSDTPQMVESKVLYSIINKQPKRADHYWLLRMEYVDEPDTLCYNVDELVPGTLFSVGIKVGFRVQPMLSVCLRQIVEDLVEAGRLDLTSTYPSLRRHGIPGDFRFTVIHRIFSASSSCPGSDRFIMSLYEKIRYLGISDQEALGLDTSNVTVETVPLILNTRPSRRITPI